NAITKAGAEAANYPFCTIEPNVGVVDVPDNRLAVLAEMFGSKRILPAAMRFVDIAGLVEGASKGEGLGNKFLSHIRQVDAIAQVIRCFDDPNITHVAGSIDPIRDIEIINTELCLADLESVEKRKQRIEKIAKSGDKDARAELPLLERIIEGLGEAKPVRAQGLDEDELEMIKELTLLTAKPSLYVANAWTIVNGTKAPQAAGKIHSDIEKGFIRAEIVSFDDLQACGSQNAAKEKGLVRLEGKDYVMKDGDVTHFRFNV
ncbi:MAG: redox-regulated ATPase YchF, partial [Veillonella sp.]|nr:redox-regulated ATPase YchF [Veillonella sp.]